MRRPKTAILVSLALLIVTVAATTAQGGNSRLVFPEDPLRSSLGFSFGLMDLEDDAYKEYFDVTELQAWTLRYDYRFWHSLRIGLAVTASDKNHTTRIVAIDSEAYPVRFNFSAFQSSGEIYLRGPLPKFMFLSPHFSIGKVVSRLHAESSGYDAGYEAFWEEFPIAEDVIQTSGGWRFALGAQFHLWANVNILLEASRLDIDDYDEPTDADPPVGEWNSSGLRIEAGLIQRF